MYSVHAIIPDKMSHQNWEKPYGLFKQIHQEKKRNKPFITREEFILRETSLIRHQKISVFLLENDNQAVGWMAYLSQVDSRGIPFGTFFLALLKKEKLPIEAEILLGKTLLSEMEKAEHLHCIWSFANQELLPFADDIYAEKINQKNIYLLKKRDLNEAKIENWVESVCPEKLGLSYELYEFLPKSMYNEFSELLTLLSKDIIRENDLISLSQTPEDFYRTAKQNKEAGHSMLHFLLFDPDKKLVGMTNITVPMKPQSLIFQWMTGLRKDYRGKGLARWLKAKMLQALEGRFPDSETILTDCYAANLPMIQINLELGFKIEREESEFLVGRKGIEEYLREKIN